MAVKPELRKAIAREKIRANDWNGNFDNILEYINAVEDELKLKVNTINSQLSTNVINNLQKVYPVGSLYISTTSSCPLADLFGTWVKVGAGRVLQVTSGSQNPNTNVAAGLPNVTGQIGAIVRGGSTVSTCSGPFTRVDDANWGPELNGTTSFAHATFSLQKGNSIYGASTTVQPPAYLVNVWRRTE